jgi:sporulation protein YunB
VSLKDNINYSDLISIVKNEQGEITLISANSLKINSLSQKIIKETKENLDLRLEKGIPVPVLAFIGLPIVSGYGRQVMFNTMHVASVNCEFDSKFTSVGINQTIHSIYVKVICDVRIDMPINEKKQNFSSSVLICETVLIGKVPQIYLS